MEVIFYEASKARFFLLSENMCSLTLKQIKYRILQFASDEILIVVTRLSGLFILLISQVLIIFKFGINSKLIMKFEFEELFLK